MMLRLQTERMAGTETPSQREYFNLFGLDSGKLMRGTKRIGNASRPHESWRRD